MTGEIGLLIEKAKHGDQQAIEALLLKFDPLLTKLASSCGYLDDDCKQELAHEFIKAVDSFNYEKYLND